MFTVFRAITSLLMALSYGRAYLDPLSFPSRPQPLDNQKYGQFSPELNPGTAFSFVEPDMHYRCLHQVMHSIDESFCGTGVMK
jgi:hypothetical protein